MSPDEYFRFWLRSHRPHCASHTDADAIPVEADCARVQREGRSHTGISRRPNLRLLEAQAVNQAFLDELATLHQLEYLALEAPVTAANLDPLSNLTGLRILKITSPREVRDFSPILALPNLERLFIENAKHMSDLNWLRPLSGRLRVLGIEGGMYTAQRIPTLRPLEEFALDALFLTNTVLGDKSFAPLHGMTGLIFLGTSRNAPRTEFEALHEALPQLYCDWFQPAMWGGLDKLVSDHVAVESVDLRLPEIVGIRLAPRA